MKEVAVLKWHQTGCYAVAFSQVGGGEGAVEAGNLDKPSASSPVAKTASRGEDVEVEPPSDSTSLVPSHRVADLSVKARRIRYAETAHWLAAGSKDGRVSLWDIF